MDQTADLQAQIDRLSLALHQWRQTQDHLQPMERRLADLTERCSEILNRWSDTDQRHVRAVNAIEDRLTEWSAVEDRLHHDSLQRLRELERTIEREWHALREVHEAPVTQLREQATALGETCMAAANLALRGFERTEARLAALESDLQLRLNQLSHDIQAAIADARREVDRPPPRNVAPFPLEGVVRIHEGLRAVGDTSDEGTVRLRAAALDVVAARVPDPAPRQLPEAAALATRVESLERELSSGKQEARDTATITEHLQRNWRVALIGGLVTIAAGIGFALFFNQRVNSRLDEAAARVTAAELEAAAVKATATQQIAATRQDAERQITEARQSATQAQIVGHVLAAPDLVRFALVGADTAQRSYAQVLWSRTRGLVLSASLLPPPPVGFTYQVWWLGGPSPVLAGALVPDAGGRAALAIDDVATAPRPMTAVIVTLEPGDVSTPTGVTVLSRASQ